MFTDVCLICLIVCQSAAMFAFLVGRIAPVRYHAATTFLTGLVTVLAVWNHWAVPAYVCAVFTALGAWRWWNSGGGGGTRRRLKSWARRFQGTRCTAPS
ncbi:hypothetical protein [Streptomyces longispororuber]|uniref:hypothetical protein n=1 Tax=Streptomyces longispororuber TaxID=68230 RepID=UPI0036F87CFC